MDDELKKYLEEINAKLDRILEILSIKPADIISEEENEENKDNVEKIVEEIEQE